FESVRLFEDTSINSLSFAIPGSRLPSLGVSMVALSSGQFQRTNELNNPLGTFSEGETAYLFSLAKGLSSRFSLGTNFKIVHQSVEDFSGTGFGVDLGGIFQLTPSLRVGASVLNLGGPTITLRSAPESYATEFRGGLSLQVLNGRAHISGEV